MEKIYTLDKLDKKILVALTENARYSYSTIAKMVGTKREVVTYRINRMIENGIIEKFTTTLFRPGITFEITPHIYLKLGIATDERIKEIIDELKKLPYIIILSKCEGSFNIYLMPLCKNEYHLRKILDDIKKTCKFDLQDYEIIDVVSDNYANGLFFIENEKIELKEISDKGGSFQSTFKKSYYKKGLPGPRELELDNLDLEIIDIIEKNSRIPLIEIAKETKSDLIKIKNRINKFIKKRLIRRFNPIINHHKLGYHSYDILIRLHGDENEQKKLISKLRENKNCYYLALCNGRWDYLFSFQIKNSETLRKFMNEILAKYANVLIKYEIIWVEKNYKNNSYPRPMTRIFHEKPITSLVQTLNK